MLMDAIESFHKRASGKHEIAFIVGCDADDPHTVTMGHMLRLKGLPVTIRCRERGPSLGTMVNDIISEYPADVYCTVCDDVAVITQDWDEILHAALKAVPDGVWWWKTNADSRYAIISEKWRAASGRVFTDYFPFWWDDVWLIQIWKYVTGQDILMLDAWLKDDAPATHRMRDLSFWTDFYWSRGSERREQAERIRKILGRPFVKPALHHELQPNTDFMRRMREIEANQGETSPPTAEYLRAKARAESMMNERKVA